MRPDQVHGFQDFGVLTGEVFRLGRVQLLIEGDDLAAVDFGPGHVAEPVALMQFARAAVPHHSQVLHFLGILLADIAQVQRQHRVGLNPQATHPH